MWVPYKTRGSFLIQQFDPRVVTSCPRYLVLACLHCMMLHGQVLSSIYIYPSTHVYSLNNGRVDVRIKCVSVIM